MKRTIRWLFAVIFGTGLALAQPAVQWTHSYIGMTNPVPNEVIQTLDGGYAVGGVAEIYSAYLQKVNSAGTLQWRSFSFPAGSARGHAVKDIIENPDSSLVVIGTNYYNPWDARYWFASKVTGSGANVWANVVTNGIAYGDPWSLARCSDGGYMVGGENYAGMLRLSSTGTNLFERLYDGELRSAFPMTDGSFTGAGTNSISATAPDFYLVHTDMLGQMNWQHTYALPGGQVCYGMDCTADGGYVLAGYDSLGSAGSTLDLLVMRTNASGDTLWTRKFDSGWDDYAWDVHQTQDGGYILLAYIGGAGYLMKLNAAGDSLWSLFTNAWALSTTADGGYITANFNSSQLILTKYAPDIAPAAPQELTTELTNTNLLLRWRSSLGATSYRVYSSDAATGPFSQDLSGTFADTTWTVPVSLSQKFYQVTAVR